MAESECQFGWRTVEFLQNVAGHLLMYLRWTMRKINLIFIFAWIQCPPNRTKLVVHSFEDVLIGWLYINWIASYIAKRISPF
jgi:hypothetical protein